jgi:hypothetical protein
MHSPSPGDEESGMLQRKSFEATPPRVARQVELGNRADHHAERPQTMQKTRLELPF